MRCLNYLVYLVLLILHFLKHILQLRTRFTIALSLTLTSRSTSNICIKSEMLFYDLGRDIPQKSRISISSLKFARKFLSEIVNFISMVVHQQFDHILMSFLNLINFYLLFGMDAFCLLMDGFSQFESLILLSSFCLLL